MNSIQLEGEPFPARQTSTEAGRYGRTSEGAKAKQFICNLTKREIREFLLALIDEDERVRHRITSRFGTPDASRARVALNAEIDAIWYRYKRNGDIGYHDAFKFEQDLNEAFWNVMSPLFRPQTLMETIEVSYAFLLQLTDIENDDSDGFFTCMIDQCINAWDEIIRLSQYNPCFPKAHLIRSVGLMSR